MAICGGSPQVRSLPDRHSLHLWRPFSKRVSIVQCSNPRLALLFHTPVGLNGDRQIAIILPRFAAVAMTKEEERELREQLARLQQEHRDLDAAISALQHSPGADL